MFLKPQFILCLVLGLGMNACDLQKTPQSGEASPSVRPQKMLKITAELKNGKLTSIESIQSDNAINRRDPHRRSNFFYRAFDSGEKVLSQRGIRYEPAKRMERTDNNGKTSGIRFNIENPALIFNVALHANLHVIRVYNTQSGDEVLIGEVFP